MRIVIDMQGAQGSSHNRGIGRYTLSLAEGIVRNRGIHEVFLALNGLFPDTIGPIRTVFDGLLPQENIRVWQSPGPVNTLDNNNIWRRNAAELLREAFLASFHPDIILISSLFEGLNDDIVTSIGTLSHTLPTAVILYDLIPLIQRETYLKNPIVENWYEHKLYHVRQANLLLAISESARQEGIHHLKFPPETCINISTAADPRFQPKKISPSEEKIIRKRYGLHQQFVMYTGGIDHRKNIEGLIRAYAKLPKLLRVNHQLAIVCSIQPANRARLEALAKTHGLKPNELILTGFVSEEDLLILYNLCKAFVFPSLHEGFGLPALEAMSCGRAVMAASTSSLPEVIGQDEALFDPTNDKDITKKLTQVLTDNAFRKKLEQHGLERAKLFSWDKSAQRAIIAMETWHIKHKNTAHQSSKYIIPTQRPKLAYLSPLPPERSGISDYSSELLPELSRYYNIDFITAQDDISDPWVKANCQLRNIAWFKAHANHYDRVLYQFGNSHFHQHMFNLLEEIPGIVILHDFFLSGIAAHMDITGYQPNFWTQVLYQSHSYIAVRQQFHTSDQNKIILRYPCNLEVLRNALGIIVHSENSCRLANEWYGEGTSNDWTVIPLLRTPKSGLNRTEVRRQLGLNQNDFVVCSFGMLASTKLNHRLLNAWLKSTLAKHTNCVLIFVGENHGSDYGKMLVTTIHRSNLKKRIQITGWANTDTFHAYLAAADVGVQLRTFSRGETSAAVLDCMNYGLPTIVNTNGSMADLPDDGVWKLPDEFDDDELITALETLWHDPSLRAQLGTRAKTIILNNHSPQNCTKQYMQTIETTYQTAHTKMPALIRALAHTEPAPTEDQPWIELTQAISSSIPPRLASRQLLIDVSVLIQNEYDINTQQMIRRHLQTLLTHTPKGFRVEPIYNTPHGYHYARQFTLRFLNCPESVLTDDIIEYYAGDRFLGLKLNPDNPTQLAFYQRLRNYGVQIQSFEAVESEFA